ncbi:MAG: hypothetical protein QXY45_04025 [Candidatus Aenigmatarchaeota archaeon]
MILENKTKGMVISRKVIVRRSFGVIIGLLPYKKEHGYLYDFLKPKRFDEDMAMLFKVRSPAAVHTWFMSFPICVVFLYKGKVVDKVLLKPFKRYKPEVKFDSFIEMDESKWSLIEKGDTIGISES